MQQQTLTRKEARRLLREALPNLSNAMLACFLDWISIAGEYKPVPTETEFLVVDTENKE